MAYVWKPVWQPVQAPLAAADAGRLVARAAGAGAAVQGAEDGVEALDVLHDVDLADARPVLVVPRYGRARASRTRASSRRGRAGDVRQLEPGLDAQLAAGRAAEVGAVGLDAARGPVAGGVAQRGDARLPLPSQRDVVGAVRHRLDLAGAPVGGRRRDSRCPMAYCQLAVDAGAGGAVEVVDEDLRPAGRRGGRGGGRGRRAGHDRTAAAVAATAPAAGRRRCGRDLVRGGGIGSPRLGRPPRLGTVGTVPSPDGKQQVSAGQRRSPVRVNIARSQACRPTRAPGCWVHGSWERSQRHAIMAGKAQGAGLGPRHAV